MRSISSHSAMRLATGVSSGVTCVEARELEKPMAPAFSASFTAAAMRAMSSSVAASLQRALAHDVHAQRRVADIHAVVDRLGQALDGREIFREGLPGPVDAGGHRLGRDVLDRRQAARIPVAVLGLAGRQREAAIAHHHRGDAVPARAAAQRIPRHLRVHVGVAVDEARRHDQAVGIDRARRGRRDAADLDDAAVLDADIGGEARLARAVDDGAAADEEIEGHHRRSFCSTIFQ